jgi:hypothetical protein
MKNKDIKILSKVTNNLLRLSKSELNFEIKKHKNKIFSNAFIDLRLINNYFKANKNNKNN